MYRLLFENQLGQHEISRRGDFQIAPVALDQAWGEAELLDSFRFVGAVPPAGVGLVERGREGIQGK